MKQIRKTLCMACLVVSLTAGSMPAGLAFAEPVQTDSADTVEESAPGYDETVEAETECLEMEDFAPDSRSGAAPVSASPAAAVPENDPPAAGIMRVPAGGFADVQDSSAEYYDAVSWAAENNIISGTDDGYFGVNELFTRQQFILSLWKMAGKPAPQRGGSSFADVSESDSYYHAVLWAAEQGIVTGDDGSFGVGRPCSRAEIAEYLWKLAGKPLPQTTKNPYKDISKSSEYYHAVLWAAENGMAGGCTADHFYPQDYCLKQDIAVALYGYSKCDPETFYLPEMPQPAAETHLMGVLVTWEPVGGAEDYRIYRRTSSDSWQRIGDTLDTFYLDRTPEEDTTYYYTVRCISGDGRRFKSYFVSPGAKITTAKTIVRADHAPGQEKLTVLMAEAEEAYRIAKEELALAQQDYETALGELSLAQQEFDAAQAALQEAQAQVQADPESYTNEQLLALEKALQTAQEALQAAQEKADAAGEALEAATDKVQQAEEAIRTFGEGLDFYVPAAGLRFEEECFSLATGESLKLPLILEPENACEYDVIWLSSDESIATVDDCGVVTAHTCGEVQITAALADGTQATCTVQTLYYDVADSSLYYYAPVYWAAKKNITKGYGNVYFGPDDPCTREQMVVFLWRMAGQPAPQSKDNPFSDVKKSSYYYNAVLWAVEEGITNGYEDGSFGVGRPCLREHLVTFLWRMAGRPLPRSSGNAFPDISKSNYYYNAVLWAAEEGITKGYSDGSFGPDKDCLRQHTVTFLYRYSKCDPNTFYLSEIPKVSAQKRLYSVQVTWSSVPGAEKYRVYRKPASGSWERIADTTATQFEDRTAAGKTTYYYTVRCISADGSRFKSAFETPGAKVTTPSVFPHTENEMRQLIVDLADSYIGTQGQSAKHKHILDVFNQLQPDGAPMYLYSPWCAAFASAVCMEALGNDLADKYFPLSYNCGTIIRKAVTKDIWMEKDTYTPKAGDWIIYDWDDGGSGEDITGADHVGIVKSVSGKTITVIEGNNSNACRYRTISVGGRYIRGYVTPKYGEILKR